MIQHYPVAIIGCGPAGIAASLFLSKAGIQHIIIEKESFPRDKICGDGCSGKTVSVLKKADPKIVAGIFADKSKFLPSYGVKFVAPNGKALNVPFALDKNKLKYPPGFTSRRFVLDNFLFNHLQSDFSVVVQSAAVTDLQKTDDGFLITYKSQKTQQQIQCKLLIGADGDKGICRKQLLQNKTVVKTNSAGIRAYYTGVADLHPDHFIELHFIKNVLPGYFWIFPLPGGEANVGLGIDSKVVRKKKMNMREVMLDIINAHPQIKLRFSNATLQGKIYGWGLPMSNGKGKISGDNFVLTGDAASLIDPFTGEGIGNALFSGMLAAGASASAIAANDYSGNFLHSHYEEMLYRKIGSELKLSGTLQKLLHYPSLFNLVVNKANKSSTLRETITGMFSNLDLRSRLTSPKFYWDVLTNR